MVELTESRVPLSALVELMGLEEPVGQLAADMPSAVDIPAAADMAQLAH